MGLLSSALPGVRDIRAPLVAGYVWLLVVWFAVESGDSLSSTLENNGLGSIVELAASVGTVGTAAAVSVVAYLVGAVSRSAARPLEGLAKWSLEKTPWRLRDPIKASEIDLYVQKAVPLARPWAESTVGMFAVRDALRNSEAHWDKMTEMEREQLVAVAASTAPEAERSIDIPATILLSGNPITAQLFGEVDRQRAEADFRLTVSLPLIALALVLAIEFDWKYVLLVLAPVVLIYQAAHRDHEARIIMTQFVGYKTMLATPPVSQFEMAVNEVVNVAANRSA